MRLAVLADVHANLPALQAVLADAQSCGVSGYLVAGDLFAGPQPDECVRLLQSFGAQMIRGNSDISQLRFAAGEAPPAWATARQWALVRWNHAHISADTRAAVAALPEQRVLAFDATHTIRMVHGSPRSPFEGLDPDLEPQTLDLALAAVAEPVLVCGHTHIAWTVERDGRLALNPGAVCGPLNGDVRAQYALLEWAPACWHAELRAVPYDLAGIRRAFEESGLLDEGGPLARAFLLSIETARNIGDDFLQYAFRLAAEHGHAGCEIVPDEVWERAAAEFDWAGATTHAVSRAPGRPA